MNKSNNPQPAWWALYAGITLYLLAALLRIAGGNNSTATTIEAAPKIEWPTCEEMHKPVHHQPHSEILSCF